MTTQGFASTMRINEKKKDRETICERGIISWIYFVLPFLVSPLVDASLKSLRFYVIFDCWIEDIFGANFKSNTYQ